MLDVPCAGKAGHAQRVVCPLLQSRADLGAVKVDGVVQWITTGKNAGG